MTRIDQGRWAGQALSLLRIVAALLFVMHGTSKLLGFPSDAMSPPPMSLFWIAGVLEILGGLMLIVGVGSRPVALLLSGEMAIAYWMVHAPQSTYPMLNGGESAILFCFVFLLIAAAGPGPWSLDASMRGRRIVVDEERENRDDLA